MGIKKRVVYNQVDMTKPLRLYHQPREIDKAENLGLYEHDNSEFYLEVEILSLVKIKKDASNKNK